MENKVKHLELIEQVVNRLASNSFKLKEWTVLLVSALFAVAAKDARDVFVCLAYFPAFAFWGLDAYFLRQERLFRKLYDKVRLLPDDSIDFSMSTAPLAKSVDPWVRTCFSKTLLAFYGTVMATIVFVMMLMR